MAKKVVGAKRLLDQPWRALRALFKGCFKSLRSRRGGGTLSRGDPSPRGGKENLQVASNPRPGNLTFAGKGNLTFAGGSNPFTRSVKAKPRNLGADVFEKTSFFQNKPT
ncbi:hypothetical protein RRG08_007218 [Elysia crispata]|uniref:Uncharacterized protein n=1 Tax=Elysia crispata TaxID=231223 RepID=A0AAE0Z4K2_9GAST|nr:hypothetical protein RRG08_007218 [Elysia crispata]